MSIRTEPWPAGYPCWLDLSTPDVVGASTFYSAILPWKVAEPDVEYGGYVMADVDGVAAAGIGPQQPGAPVAWTLYFASDDADATAAAVTAAGGAVMLPPSDVGPLGRMFIAADPTGAAFGVWQSGTHHGAGVVNEPGGLAWEDLRSTDPDAAKAFYHQVFGWEFAPLAMGGPDYATFSAAGTDRPLGGLGGMMGADGMPSHWLVYLGVADAAAAVATAEQHGGAVVAADFETPFGRMAGLMDPDGAPFWVHQAAESADPN